MIPTEQNTSDHPFISNNPNQSFTSMFETGRFLTVSGIVNSDGHVLLEPGFQMGYRRRIHYGQLDDKALANVIILEFLDEKRQMLTQCPIPLSPICAVDKTGSGMNFKDRIFASSVSFPVDSHIIRFHIAGKLVKEIKKPTDPPVIKLIQTPKGTVADTEIIKWEVENKIDTDIRSVILYSNTDNQSWCPITSTLSSRINSIPISFAHLPGGKAKLKVLATDGFSTAIAESSTFDVPLKGIRASILGPMDGAITSTEKTTWFHGQAYNYETQSITTDNMFWSSSIDGELGQGPVISAHLSAGTHTITLKCHGHVTNLKIVVQSDRKVHGTTQHARQFEE